FQCSVPCRFHRVSRSAGLAGLRTKESIGTQIPEFREEPRIATGIAVGPWAAEPRRLVYRNPTGDLKVATPRVSTTTTWPACATAPCPPDRRSPETPPRLSPARRSEEPPTSRRAARRGREVRARARRRIVR